jgi:hypothetical protein
MKELVEGRDYIKPLSRPGPPPPHPRKCDHKYHVLKNNTETIFADGKPYLINVSTVFYCERCLDIKHKEEKIHYD